MPLETSPPHILLTAFEPSGDEHASVLIAELRRRHPDWRLSAWGGPRMAEAGAEVVERTGENAVMGVPGPKVIREHINIGKRIDRWMADNRPVLHIPVDSPAANFPICKLSRKHGVAIAHLVAPQLWAWGHWRVAKLRRLSDRVMCLLPFEERWFRERGVPATFVGHPVYDRPIDEDAVRQAVAGFPQGSPRLGVFPGSRPSEAERNFPIFLNAFRTLQEKAPGMVGIVAATTPAMLERLERIASEGGGWPESLAKSVGVPDAVTRWCDAALTVSGTNTLRIARQRRPMVVCFRASTWQWRLLGSRLIKTPHLALPNLVAGRRIVPELMPMLTDDPAPVVDAVLPLLTRWEARQRQASLLDGVARQFESTRASVAAADVIEEVLAAVSPAQS